MSATVVGMRRIGIRELRQDASTYVHQAAEGESFTITLRGRPVARLVPLDELTRGVEMLLERGAQLPEARIASWSARRPLDEEPLTADLDADRDERP